MDINFHIVYIKFIKEGKKWYKTYLVSKHLIILIIKYKIK